MKTQDFLAHLQSLDIKLSVKEGQLRCNAPKGVLTPDLQQELKARKQEILEFLQALDPPATKNRPAIERVNRDQPLPLSFSQQRLWFLEQLETDSATYNIPASYRLSGSIDVAALEQSFKEIIRRHEVLRTTFQSQEGQPYQAIESEVEFSLSVIDLSHLPSAEREAEAQQLVQKEKTQVFNLTQGSLFAATLLRLDAQDHILIVTMHHIISDGWSMGVLFRELSSLYQAFSQGQPSPLPELPVQYADFAVWQRQWLQGEVLDGQLAYWRKQLQGAAPILELPTDHPRPPRPTYRGARYQVNLDKDLVDSLKALSQQEGSTLFMALLAAFNILLYRYTGQEDIVVGSPIANRTHAEIEGLIGFFVNTLAFRTNLAETPNFRTLLNRVRRTALDAYAHQDVPFEKLIEELKPERSLSYSPLFQVMFVLQNTPSSPLELPGLTMTPQTNEGEAAKFDLTFSLRETAKGLVGFLEYSTDLFEESTIARMVDHFQTILRGIVANPDQPISTLPLLTEAEQHQLLVEWNQTQTEYPSECIHQIFEQQVEKTPDAVAVVFRDRQLTYKELNDRANQLAHYLRSMQVGTEVLVGISVEPSIEMVIGLLGILKSGGAYLPVDPAYPLDRQSYMLEDSQVGVLLTQQHLLEGLPESKARVICLDSGWEEIAQSSSENPVNQSNSETLAYVIYTSGSTGRPKGVLVTHRGVPNLAAAQSRVFRVQSDSRVLQFASFSFDACVSEVVMALYAGAALYLESRDARLPGTPLLQLLKENKITHVTLPPSGLAILPQDDLPDLQSLIVAGEACPPGLVTQWSTNRHFFNAYGPTEATVCATIAECEDTGTPPTIGRPIDNTQIYILDRQLQPVPVGVPGEVFVGGIGLARGYLNRPDLTAEKFIPHPFSQDKEAKLYRTGDLARYLPDGNIEFLGRIDYQVKIRGFRIELGEIEAILEQHPAVAQCVVIDREDTPGDKRLIAYLVYSEAEPPTASELRQFLQQKLPDYMLPSAFVGLDALPITPNGKVDRRALPKPDYLESKSDEEFTAARDELESKLIEIWETTLGVKPIGVKDNFFDLGGHSLLAVQLFAQIEKIFGKALPLATLFQAATVEDLANIIREKNWLAPWSSLVPIQPNGSKPPLFYIHAGGGNLLVYRELAYSLGADQPVYGLQPRGLDGQFDPFQTIEDMADYYLAQILTVQPEGPYFLAGLSTGGMIAYEMAQRLQQRGQQVGLLAMFDTLGPGYPQALPPLPRLGSVTVWSAGDWSKRMAAWPQKFVQQIKQAGWSKTSRLVLEKLKIVQPTLDEEKQIQALRERNILETKVEQYEAQGSHWTEKLINSLIIGMLKNSSHPYYANVFASSLTRQRTGILSESLYEIQDATRSATQSYIPQPYAGKVTFFQAGENPPGIYHDPKRGWSNIQLGEIEVYEIPGDHTSLVKSPLLAEKLRACLEQAHQKLLRPTK